MSRSLWQRGSYWQCVVLASSVLVLFAFSARAELVFNLPTGEVERESREASAVLLAGISGIFDALAAVEARQRGTAEQAFETVRAQLAEAGKRFEILKSRMAFNGRKLNFSRISAARLKIIQRRFTFYKLPVPNTEGQVIDLAVGQVGNLQEVLRRREFAYEGKDLKAARTILSAVTRLLAIGTMSAELAATAE